MCRTEMWRGKMCLSSVVACEEKLCQVDGGSYVCLAFLEKAVSSAPEHAACWCGGGTFPGAAKVHCARFVVEVAEAAHERIAEATEMDSISYFLGEYVADVVVSNDVLNFECCVLDPFVNCVFFEFHVTHSLQSHVVGPEDGGLVVVVHYRGGIGVSG